MILFRADGNHEIGTGHIMRCLSIADAFRQNGEKCIFVVAGDYMNSVISERGFEAIVLNTVYTDMNSELNDFKRIIDEYSPEIIVIDSYFVTDEYLSEVRKISKIAYIDDMYAFAYPVDILINYNIYADEVRYRNLYVNNIDFPKLLLGPQFAPLRNEFLKIGEKSIRTAAKDILVLTGGTDNLGISLNIAECICGNEYSDMDFHFVVGQFNTNLKKLRKYEAEHSNIHVYCNVTRMSELMKKCDIAISAAGSTLYELCACGVPTITYILADNQIEGSDGFLAKGIMNSVGDIRERKDYPVLIMNEIQALKNNYKKRQEISVLMQKIVNSDGAFKVITELK